MKIKPLTMRAREAASSDADSKELRAVQLEVQTRLTQVEGLVPAARSALETVVDRGDPQALRDARQKLQDLQDEELLLRGGATDLFHAINAARGREAVASADELAATLGTALERATAAHDCLDECRASLKRVAAARKAAADIGETLKFDRTTVRGLASALFPTHREKTQALIDLGAARLRENSL